MTTQAASALSACFAAYCALLGTACTVTGSADPLWWLIAPLVIAAICGFIATSGGDSEDDLEDLP